MGQRTPVLLMTVAASLGATPLLAAEAASVGQDLKATIALNGMPCDQIVDVKRNGDSDYVATCKDGNRYHVFVSPQGRARVDKL